MTSRTEWGSQYRDDARRSRRGERLRDITHVDPSAADSRRRRQPESFGAAASRKTDGAPPSQLKLSAAASADIFTARRGL